MFIFENQWYNLIILNSIQATVENLYTPYIEIFFYQSNDYFNQDYDYFNLPSIWYLLIAIRVKPNISCKLGSTNVANRT